MKKVSILLSSLIALNSLSSLAASPAQLEQCATDLCGPSGNYQRFLSKGDFANANRETKTFIKENIDTQLQRLFKSALRTRSIQNQLAQNMLQENAALTGEQRAFLAVQSYVTSLTPIVNDVIVSPDGRLYQISAEKLKEKRPDLSQQQVDHVVAVLNTFLATSDFAAGRNIPMYPYDAIVEVYGVQFAPTITKAVTELFQIFQKVGAGLKTMVDVSALQKPYKDPNSLTKDQQEAFLQAFGFYYTLKASISPEVQKAVGTNFGFKEAAEFVKWSEKFENNQKILRSKDAIFKQKKEVLESCHTSFASKLATGPSELRQNKTQELLERVKKAGSTVTTRYFTGERLKMAQAAIRTMKFVKPPTADELRMTAIEQIKTSANTAEKALTDLTLGTDVDKASFAILALVAESKSEATVFESVRGACRRVEPKFFNDAAFPSLNAIVTSWQSTVFQEVGVGVLAHELGHIVSFAVQEDTFSKFANKFSSVRDDEGYQTARQCSIKKHADMAGSSEVAKFEQFAEEDWADVFANDVIQEVAKSWPFVTNFACPLIEIDEKTGKYKGLEIWDSSGKDTHSTSLYRALLTQVALKRPVPQSCTNVMTPVEQTVVAQSCSQ